MENGKYSKMNKVLKSPKWHLGKFIALSNYSKEERSQFSDLSLQLKKVGKYERIKPNQSINGKNKYTKVGKK
jgi:hypothetical protein